MNSSSLRGNGLAPEDIVGLRQPGHKTGSASFVPAGEAAAGDEAANRTFKQKLGAANETWLWKVVLRVLLLLADIIAIACIAAAIANKKWSGLASNFDGAYDEDGYNLDDNTLLAYGIIPIVVSFLWCAIVAIVLLKRRPSRPLHPGVPVAIDLVLWLALIVSVLILSYCTTNVEDIGNGGYITDPAGYHDDYYGFYTLAPNGTWFYTILSKRSVYTYTTYDSMATTTTAVVPRSTAVTVTMTMTPSGATATATATVAARDALTSTPRQQLSPAATSSASSAADSGDEADDYLVPYKHALDDVTTTTSTTSTSKRSTRAASTVITTSAPVIRSCEPGYGSCILADADINTMWHIRQSRLKELLAAAVLSGIALLLHFVLFVWACIDTARNNRARRDGAVVANALENMHSRGYVMTKINKDGQLVGGNPSVSQNPAGADPSLSNGREVV